MACHYNAAGVVEYLLRAEQQQLSDGKSKLLYMATSRGYLPLHIAAEQGHSHLIHVLLQAACDPADMLLQTTEEIDTPLHLAVVSDDLASVQMLLDAHSSGSSAILESNSKWNLPLHLALQSKQKTQKIALWSTLLDADKEFASLLHVNREGITPFQYFLQRPHQLTPEFVDHYLSKTILLKFLTGHRMNYFDLKLHRSVAKSPNMQSIICDVSSNRLPVITFMADFYAHCASVAVLFIATEAHLGARKDYLGSIEAMYFLAGYFIVREFIQLLSSRKYYWEDLWNLTDIARIAMLFVTASALENLTDDSDESVTRRILLAAGVFIYVGAVSFLRATFLPFALFIGGTASIVLNLIPFLVCYGLALLCVAYGFWVGGFEDSGEVGPAQKYSEWLFVVFVTTLSGPSEYEHIADDYTGYLNRYWWTIISTVLIQIVLLNVLIAIISSEWERITRRQAEVFWKFRLEFVQGVLPAERVLQKCVPTTIQKLTERFDAVIDIRLRDKVEWDVYPYNEIVNDRSLYWDQEALLRKLNQIDAASGDAPREWEKEIGSIRSFQADFLFSNDFWSMSFTLVKLVLYIVCWTIVFFLGCLTLGLLWPRQVRLFFFGPSSTSWAFSLSDGNEARGGAGSTGQSKEQEARDALNTKLDAMNERISDLHDIVEKLAISISLPPQQLAFQGDRSQHRPSRRPNEKTAAAALSI